MLNVHFKTPGHWTHTLVKSLVTHSEESLPSPQHLTIGPHTHKPSLGLRLRPRDQKQLTSPQSPGWCCGLPGIPVPTAPALVGSVCSCGSLVSSRGLQAQPLIGREAHTQPSPAPHLPQSSQVSGASEVQDHPGQLIATCSPLRHQLAHPWAGCPLGDDSGSTILSACFEGPLQAS